MKLDIVYKNIAHIVYCTVNDRNLCTPRICELNCFALPIQSGAFRVDNALVLSMLTVFYVFFFRLFCSSIYEKEKQKDQGENTKKEINTFYMCVLPVARMKTIRCENVSKCNQYEGKKWWSHNKDSMNEPKNEMKWNASVWFGKKKTQITSSVTFWTYAKIRLLLKQEHGAQTHRINRKLFEFVSTQFLKVVAFNLKPSKIQCVFVFQNVHLFIDRFVSRLSFLDFLFVFFIFSAFWALMSWRIDRIFVRQLWPHSKYRYRYIVVIGH